MGEGEVSYNSQMVQATICAVANLKTYIWYIVHNSTSVTSLQFVTSVAMATALLVSIGCCMQRLQLKFEVNQMFSARAHL